MGCSAEELAEITAESAFKEVDPDHDGNLTAEEFQRWHSQPLGDGSASLARDTVAEATSKMSLGQLHQLTNLSPFPQPKSLADLLR